MYDCCCGKPHEPFMQEAAKTFLSQMGVPECVPVTNQDGTWRVPRIYIALHGLKSTQLAFLAQKYGWEQEL